MKPIGGHSDRLESIGRATSADADVIFEILVEAFRSSSLKFSIYQTPGAVAALREEIESPQAAIYICRRMGTVDGFYIAFRRESEFFLSSIATAPNSRGRGTGAHLLNHFEAEGASRQCSTLGLEAFKSNPAVIDWYTRRGYEPRKVRYRCRLELSTIPRDDRIVMELDPSAVAVALEDEALRGFSRIDGGWAGGTLSLGFIGGTVCNLLKPEGPDAFLLAASIAREFKNSRRWLLLSSSEPLPEGLNAETVEPVLFMSKPVTKF